MSGDNFSPQTILPFDETQVPTQLSRIAEIVLAGGSCAGKTSALELLGRSLREAGFDVLCVPEAVTMLVTAGIPDIGTISRYDKGRACQFQEQIYRIQRTLRDSFHHLAQLFPSREVVILYDRGELDALAYHDHTCISDYAKAEGTSLDSIRHSYTGVMHLVTAADGAEGAYRLAANPARWDQPDEARFFDRKIWEVWEGAPNHVLIDNSTNFVDKMERLLKAVTSVLEDNFTLGGDKVGKANRDE